MELCLGWWSCALAGRWDLRLTSPLGRDSSSSERLLQLCRFCRAQLQELRSQSTHYRRHHLELCRTEPARTLQGARSDATPRCGSPLRLPWVYFTGGKESFVLRRPRARLAWFKGPTTCTVDKSLCLLLEADGDATCHSLGL